MSDEDRVYLCPTFLTPDIQCRNKIPYQRWKIGKFTCMACGEKSAITARKSWTVLTPHKQGPMFFTPESALEMAKGINNKGGLIK
jgi:RNase P subunit RPR2